LQRLRTLHLFAGAGGGVLADMLLGHQPVCAVEINYYCQQVLAQRQKDGLLPWFPIFADVKDFDGKPWRGIVDVVSGGFPCQDISSAGRGAGIEGERSGLWRQFARIICQVRPTFAFVENSPMLTVRGLGKVLGDLASIGYNAEWCVLGANDAGAPHIRKRIWILAHTEELRRGEGDSITRGACEGAGTKGQRSGSSHRCDVPDSNVEHDDVAGYGASEIRRERETAEIPRSFSNPHGQRLEEQRGTVASGNEHAEPQQRNWWISEPDVGRVVNGVAARVDRLKSIGNGQVPAVAALAWKTLIKRL
jgi:DNA (cytosine-5)-methyltransferase 1